MMMRRLRRFHGSEEGGLSVEAALVFPILLWALGALFVFWDAFKVQNLNIKATYTIADLISREPDPLTPAYVDGLNAVYAFLLNSADAGRANDIRVSVLTNTYDEDNDIEDIVLNWSCATGTKVAHVDETALEDRLPIIGRNDQIIVVETRMDWEPPFRIGLPAGTREHLIFTSPRFVPQVLLNGTC